MTNKPKDEQKSNIQTRPEDVPDDQLEAVAAGHGHHRWYHVDDYGRRGYYRRGEFIILGP